MTHVSAPAAGAPATPLAAVTHPDPYPYYATLVGRPVSRDPALGLWVAAGAAAVTAVLSSERCRVRPLAEPVPRALLGSPAGELFARLVRMNDGARHVALKPAIAAALAALDETRMGTIADRWARRLGEEMTPAACPERSTDFAFALAASVTAELLGTPADVVPAKAAATGPLVRGLAPGADADTIRRGGEAAARLIELARALPLTGDGLLAQLTRHAPADPDAARANAIGFLFQSHDATAGLTGNTVVALARSSALRALVQTHPATLPRVVAEVARHDAPVQNTRRFVAEDGTVAGAPLRAGDTVLVLLAAANRDPAANPDPARFDHERVDPRLFTFGLGPHACPGTMVAITIATAGVAYLLRTGLPLDHVATGVTYRPSPNARIPLFAAL